METTPLQLAQANIAGYIYAISGKSVTKLVEDIALTEEEWTILKEKAVIKSCSEVVKEIDKIFMF